MYSNDDGPRFGCPHWGSTDIIEVSTTYVSYPGTSWNQDGTPAAFGDPEYGEGEEFDTYECYDCRTSGRADNCTFLEPVRRPE